MISFSQHNLMNPIIEVNGDSAKGTWYLLGPFTFREKNDARWIACRYEDDYVKINGEWKYKHLRAFIRVHAEYEKGWAKYRLNCLLDGGWAESRIVSDLNS